MIVSRESNLRAHLRELLDHNVVRLRRFGNDFAEYFTVPLSAPTLQQVLSDVDATLYHTS